MQYTEKKITRYNSADTHSESRLKTGQTHHVSSHQPLRKKINQNTALLFTASSVYSLM